jgi:hypothetical protein
VTRNLDLRQQPVTTSRIDLLRWTDFDEETTRSDIANTLGCPNGVAKCLLCGGQVMIFDTELEDCDQDGPSLILLQNIPGKGYFNIICAKCSDADDYPLVLTIARALGVGPFTTNVSRTNNEE